MTYTIYNPVTGQITSHIQASNDELAQLNLAEQSYVEGFFDGKQYYIHNGQPQLLPEPPKFDNHFYEFDWQQKIWKIDLLQTAQITRKKRNNLLTAIDRVNPVWYASLDQDQQANLQAYRLALLAVPQQAGFPSQVEWPAKPIWL
jgi:hypothetical protein